jgi:hypothetical protein
MIGDLISYSARFRTAGICSKPARAASFSGRVERHYCGISTGVTTRADVPNDDSSAEYQPRRQPRIFAIPPVVPMSTTKVEPAAEPKQIRRKAIDKRGTREIPPSQFGRVRTLTATG